MEHEDEIEQRPAPETPQNVWQSLHQEEEFGMEMSLTTDQLCAKARYRERENVWFQGFASAACLGFGAALIYGAITMEQIWFRLGLAWMGLLTALSFRGTIRIGSRRMQAGESCAQFMVRELEGSRRTLVALQWGMVLVLPSLFMWWWGAYRTMQANGLHLIDPSAWRHFLLTILGSIVWCLSFLFIGWVGLGREAKKRGRQAEELRRAIGMRA
jgi:hypothetical protein